MKHGNVENIFTGGGGAAVFLNWEDKKGKQN